MLKKNVNCIFTALLIIAALFCTFFFVTDSGLIETSFLSYHVTRTFAMAASEILLTACLIVMCIRSKAAVKQKPYSLAVFPAEIVRLIVVTSVWNWFDRGTADGMVKFRLVMSAAFVIWLASIIVFLYTVLKETTKQKE